MHVPLPGAGAFAFPFAAAAAVAVLVTGGPAGAPDTGADMQEMEVLGVLPVDDESNLLVLSQKSSGTILPLAVGRSEAIAIELRLHDAVAPRPLTHDLLGKAIEELGAKVVRVEIDAVENAVFRAKIRLSQGERRVTLDARPSDSVALALRTHAPIFASRKVLADAGLDKAELEKMRKHGHRGGSPGAPPADTLSL